MGNAIDDLSSDFWESLDISNPDHERLKSDYDTYVKDGNFSNIKGKAYLRTINNILTNVSKYQNYSSLVNEIKDIDKLQNTLIEMDILFHLGMHLTCGRQYGRLRFDDKFPSTLIEELFQSDLSKFEEINQQLASFVPNISGASLDLKYKLNKIQHFVSFNQLQIEVTHKYTINPINLIINFARKHLNYSGIIISSSINTETFHLSARDYKIEDERQYEKMSLEELNSKVTNFLESIVKSQLEAMKDEVIDWIENNKRDEDRKEFTNEYFSLEIVKKSTPEKGFNPAVFSTGAAIAIGMSSPQQISHTISKKVYQAKRAGVTDLFAIAIQIDDWLKNIEDYWNDILSANYTNPEFKEKPKIPIYDHIQAEFPQFNDKFIGVIIWQFYENYNFKPEYFPFLIPYTHAKGEAEKLITGLIGKNWSQVNITNLQSPILPSAYIKTGKGSKLDSSLLMRSNWIKMMQDW